MNTFYKLGRVVASGALMLAVIGSVFAAVPAYAADPASPGGCNADNSIVNIARSTASASFGEVITFSVTAGNEASVDGCDVSGRVMTLTLPDGTFQQFGPINYPNPTGIAFVGSMNYVASSAHLVGDTGTSEYTIALTKVPGETTHSVTGTITIHNPALVAANITSVADVLSLDGAADTLNCPVSFPHSLAPGANLVCTYSATLVSNTTQTNTATVATTGDVGGDSGEAIVDFSNIVPSVTNGEVNVDDTYALGDAGPFSNSASYTYTRPFACGTEQGQYTGTGNIVPNTATITETGQNDSAEVTVNCYDLTVTKTANTTFDREYDLNIEKTADATEITLATDQSYDIHYTVTASVVGQTDSNFAVAGNITIANNNPTMQADLTTVIDTISVAIGAAVNCPATVVPASGSIVCT